MFYNHPPHAQSIEFICPSCQQTFDTRDWQSGPWSGGVCFYCSAATATPEQRREGFIAAMRLVDTKTLKRWASNEKLTTNRRDVATMVLRERGEQS